MGTRAGLYGRESQAKQKSVDDQLAVGREEADAHGWTVTHSFSDKVSASRHGRKTRVGWPEVLEAVTSDSLDVVVLWEPSRGSRELEDWARFLNACRKHGVKIHAVSHQRTYDPRNARDWRSLAEDGVDAAYESDKTSARVRRGVKLSAEAGRPAQGPAPYGYARVYDPRTGALTGQEPDPVTAPIAAEIVRRVGQAEPIAAIVRDLEARGVPVPTTGEREGRSAAYEWSGHTVRRIARNPAYAGLRVHRPTGEPGAKALHPGGWEAIVTEAEHYAAERAIAARFTTKHKPGAQVHLLTFLARCGRCDNVIIARGGAYSCKSGCVTCNYEQANEWVRLRAIAYLAQPATYKALKQQAAGDASSAAKAKQEAETLRARLESWRLSAAKGETTPASLATIEAQLTVEIAAADARAERAGLPAVLAPFAEPGADVEARWDDATLAARREILRLLWDITITPLGRGRYRGVTIDQRVSMERHQTSVM